MSEVQAPGISEREVTIYATRGGQMQKIMTSANTWGELQPLVRNAGFDLSSLLAAENITKTDLVNDLAVLPTTAFRLFLRPKQTKSGAPDRKECFAIIKSYLAQNPRDKAKFTINGKNVTQLTTPVVQDLVCRYCQGITAETATVGTTMASPVTTVSSVDAIPSKMNTTTNEPVAKNKVVGTVDSINNSDLTNTERVEEALTLIAPLSEYPSYHKALKHLGLLRFEVWDECSENAKESEEETLRREAREMGY